MGYFDFLGGGGGAGAGAGGAGGPSLGNLSLLGGDTGGMSDISGASMLTGYGAMEPGANPGYGTTVNVGGGGAGGLGALLKYLQNMGQLKQNAQQAQGPDGSPGGKTPMPTGGGGPAITWDTTAPDAIARAEREQRQWKAYGQLGGDVVKLGALAAA